MITKSKNGTVTFTFDGQSRKTVYLCGDFNRWDVNATRLVKKDNQWTTQLKLKPGTYQFRYFVDGAWYNDKQADGYTPNPFGGENSLITVAN